MGFNKLISLSYLIILVALFLLMLSSEVNLYSFELSERKSVAILTREAT